MRERANNEGNLAIHSVLETDQQQRTEREGNLAIDLVLEQTKKGALRYTWLWLNEKGNEEPCDTLGSGMVTCLGVLSILLMIFVMVCVSERSHTNTRDDIRLISR